MVSNANSTAKFAFLASSRTCCSEEVVVSIKLSSSFSIIIDKMCRLKEELGITAFKTVSVRHCKVQYIKHDTDNDGDRDGDHREDDDVMVIMLTM